MAWSYSRHKGMPTTEKHTASESAMMHAVEDPLAFVLEWAFSKTLAGSIEPLGSSFIAVSELDMSSREYSPASTPRSAQPPTPSATPMACSSTQIKCASSPPVSSLSGWGRQHDPEISFRDFPADAFLQAKPSKTLDVNASTWLHYLNHVPLMWLWQ